MVRDPVCGMDVHREKSNYSVKFDGEDYHFCSASCQEAFEKNPVKYTEVKSTGHE